jgi:ABC-type lipoprotein release transport system permease subunit
VVLVVIVENVQVIVGVSVLAIVKGFVLVPMGESQRVAIVKSIGAYKGP